MASSLPNPQLRPAFQISDNGLVPRDDDGFPCEVNDYVLDSQKWVNDIARPGQRTVRGVLEDQNRPWFRNCFSCEQDWRDCPKVPCVRAFHTLRRRWEYQQKFQSKWHTVLQLIDRTKTLWKNSMSLRRRCSITVASFLILYIIVRPAGDMGLGVFAGRHLLEGEILDEYFGELMPKRLAARRHDDNYIFEIGNVASSTAKEYGNWTRFMNHSCAEFNVEATDDVLGGRRTITFRALKNISEGTQLFIDYGPNYFGKGKGHILCRCPDFKGPHVRPRDGSKKRKADQDALPQTPARKQKRQKKNIPSDVSTPQKNAWIEKSQTWLDNEAPTGYPHWTILHWRMLERLIRLRRKDRNWRGQNEFLEILPSSGDDRIKKPISDERSQLTIMEWHLDVVKAFQNDEVCGTKDGQPWETDEILKRIFALVVAARRRKRRSGKRGRSLSTSQGPATPAKSESSGTNSGSSPTPPSTVSPQSTSKGGNLVTGFTFPDGR